MMRSSRKVLTFLFVFCAHIVVAQNISVASFKFLENDLTANTTGTMERDQNGEIAALIKVVTTEQGFVFDGGMTGIVKTKQEVGEVWVYVPHGIKKMTIKHPQLGVLRDYYFPVSIDKAKTYELVLATGKVETIVTRSANKQYVIFNVNPANAIVELDNMPLDVSSDGYAEKSMVYGTYNYRVSAANYHTEAGQVVVSAQGKSEVNVRLRPNFGWIDIKGANEYHGAHVSVDNEHIGQLPLKSDAIKSGVHQVKVMKSLYKPYEQQVTVTDDNTTSLTVELVPNFADVTFVTDVENEVWVDGKQKGKGQCSIALEIGDYTVEVKRASHRTVSEVVTISDVGSRIIQLPSPTPIFTTLDISSTPSQATVYIDGIEVGKTPLILNEVPVGNHKLALMKSGYAVNEEFLEFKVGEDNRFVFSMKTELQCNPIKDSITIQHQTREIIDKSFKDSIDKAYKKEIQSTIRLYRKRRYADALAEFSRYAEQNNYYAQYYLGEMFFHGKGVSVDYVEAVKWYENAAHQGYCKAQYKLAYCYEKGKGVSRSKKAAVKWYREAAEGNGRASYKAEIY